jgi:hypothetical protein
MKQILEKLRIRMSGNFLAIAEVLEATVPSKDIHLFAIRLYRPHNGDCILKTGATDILHTPLHYNDGSRRKFT